METGVVEVLRREVLLSCEHDRDKDLEIYIGYHVQSNHVRYPQFI